MATHSEKKDWQSIAEQASKEMNPARLRTLVEQLCSALDDSRKRRVGEKTDSSDSFSGN
jgi:hypothetical protein